MTDAADHPCLGCGRPTRVGTRLFADRLRVLLADSTPAFICGECNQRAVDHLGRQLTTADIDHIARQGLGIGLW